VSKADAAIRMPRRLVWIEEIRSRRFGCSSGSPTGNSFDEMMRNFELQPDTEFSSHVCADHPRKSGSGLL
jgi:hypothetical protein